MNKYLSKLLITAILFPIIFLGCFNQQEVVSQEKVETDKKYQINSAQELRESWWKDASLIPNSPEALAKETRLMIEKIKITDPAVIESETKRITADDLLLLDLEKNGVDTILMWALIKIELLEKNHDKLISILSSKCPIKLGHSPIEFHFAIVSIDNINLFFEAYKQARNPDAKFWTFFTLRRIFRKQRKLFPDDDEKFIVESKKWFDKNKKNITYDQLYRVGYPELTFEYKKWYRIFKPEVKLRPESPFADPNAEIREIMELFILKKPKKKKH